LRSFFKRIAVASFLESELMENWCLEGVSSDNATALVHLARFPFTVGRDAACDLAIPSAETSRQHARIEQDIGGLLRVIDLNSGNGTFVNRIQVHGSALLDDGDVVHFGVTEFRVRRLDSVTVAALAHQDDKKTVIFGRAPVLSEHFVVEERQFTEMLKSRAVRAALQPIVAVRDGRLRAFEVLGRGCVAGLPQLPMDMFAMAGRLGKEVELSEAFRWAGLSAVASLAPTATLFVNAHPKEMFTEPFYRSIELLRAMVPTAKLVVEVHETAITRIADVREMADRLAVMSVQFAYDDFGAGQARLVELKFDMGLIRDLDRANPKKRQLVAQLVRIVHDVGATALAEGVETTAEARACTDMHFDLIQGFFSGRPALPEPGWDYTPEYVATGIREIAVTSMAG
jgi:EAL domain-containing protein (putative c-di-GMP-specific phosphodiesterase class I)